MTNKAVTAGVLLVLVGALVLVAGCTFVNPASPTPPPGSTTARTTSSATSSNTTTSSGVRISTNLSVWAGYMGMPALWLDYPTYHVPLKQGGCETVFYVINGADGKHPCGVANYYIDDQAAGGKWWVTQPQPKYWEGCPGGLPGGAGGLYLYANDTAKLAVGWHTLKIDYLGDSTYAPSQFEAQFLVTA